MFSKVTKSSFHEGFFFAPLLPPVYHLHQSCSGLQYDNLKGGFYQKTGCFQRCPIIMNEITKVGSFRIVYHAFESFVST